MTFENDALFACLEFNDGINTVVLRNRFKNFKTKIFYINTFIFGLFVISTGANIKYTIKLLGYYYINFITKLF